MDQKRIPKPGEIYNHFKNKPYQIITIATNTETRELMVVYQAMYGDFRTYVRPLCMFLSEVDRTKYPDVTQKYRFERQKTQEELVDIPQSFHPQREFAAEASANEVKTENTEQSMVERILPDDSEKESINSILLEFLDAQSYTKKLEILTSNVKHMNDRLINDMAVSLDCSIEEGVLEERIQGLIFCLQAMRKFEDRRLR